MTYYIAKELFEIAVKDFIRFTMGLPLMVAVFFGAFYLSRSQYGLLWAVVLGVGLTVYGECVVKANTVQERRKLVLFGIGLTIYSVYMPSAALLGHWRKMVLWLSVFEIGIFALLGYSFRHSIWQYMHSDNPGLLQYAIICTAFGLATYAAIWLRRRAQTRALGAK